ncbi:acetolactate synthase large subunit [Candidatus Woesearchaeota archaeon]|nr:acetolactate synthase large subunit [Candidatus Woesearchaeota archaeon]
MVVIQSDVSGLEVMAKAFFDERAKGFKFQQEWYSSNVEQAFHTRAGHGREVSGAELLVICLKELSRFQPGARYIAGHHGGAILPFFEHFSKSPIFENYLHMPHEQLAAHFAEGFAAVTGKPGVAVATSGPGATNLVTGIYNAFMDSTPVVFITGNVPTFAAGSMAFQEAPICGMVERSAKGVYYVQSGSDIASAVFGAFHTAGSGRPGPVLMDFPKDVLTGKAELNFSSYSSHEAPKFTFRELAFRFYAAKELVERSVRPVLYVGQGVVIADACEELSELVHRTGIPVVTTLKGKGAFPESDSRSLGMLGMHGHVVANYSVDNADLVVAVGARFDDRVTGDFRRWAPRAKIVHLDMDPKGIGPKGARQPDVVVPSDVKLSLSMLNYALSGFERNDLSGWYRELASVKERFPTSYAQFSGRIKPQYVLDVLSRNAGGDDVFVTGVGQHQMWAAQYLMCKPRGFVTSGGAGTMGFGLPAALGAWAGLSEMNLLGKVVLVDGDESFRMTTQVLEVYARLNADVAVFVIDNKAPGGTPGGMVRQWYDAVHNSTSVPVSYSSRIESIARGYGAPSKTISRPCDVVPAIREALSSRGPAIYIFEVDPQENCLPMIPGGKSFEYQVASDGSQPFLR